MTPSVIAFVPLKLHSDRVPGKNLRHLCGRPLFAWVLDALLAAKRVRAVVVDADCQQIIDAVAALFPRVEFARRADHLLGDNVNANQLLEHFFSLPTRGIDHVLQTHATNPLLTSSTIDAAIASYFDRLGTHDSLVAVDECRAWLYNARGAALNHDPHRLQRTQEIEPLYADNSNLYVFSRSSFRLTGGRVGCRPQLFRMSQLESIDIDTEDDWQLAEALMTQRLTKQEAKHE